MYRTVIVDDEIPNLNLLSRIILNSNGFDLMNAYTKAKDLLENIEVDTPEVVFIDIEMPTMNGLELAERILEISDHINIVFVTAFDQYAIDAFNVNAMDYILKPINEASVQRVFDRLQKLSSHVPRVKVKDDSLSHVMCIKCFGDFAIEMRGENSPVSWITSKAEELIALLLIYHGKPIDKWVLCDVLWPEIEPKKASTNLHTTIYRLKKTIKKYEMPMEILRGNNGYWIEVNKGYCDYYELMHYKKNRYEKINVKQTLALIDNYKGPLFDLKGYLWVNEFNVEIDSIMKEIINLALAYFSKNDDHKKSVFYLGKIYKYYKDDEKLCQSLMEIHFRTNNPRALKQVYQEHESFMIDELDVKPTMRLRRIYKGYMNELRLM